MVLTEKKREEYFTYLDELRKSGVTNMFGAGMYLRDEFPELSRSKSHEVLGEWMKTFSDRHPKE